MAKWFDILVGKEYMRKRNSKKAGWLRKLITGSLYRVSDVRVDSSIADIKTQIDTMRALARDSQISTALSYYATDATTTNSNGDIIWATPVDSNCKEAADIVNALFKRYNINKYARDHILELATVGNLYIPTTDLYKEPGNSRESRKRVALDTNTIPCSDFDIVPSYKIPPETVVHVWYQGDPQGYILDAEDGTRNVVMYPESSIIHFSLGGMLGEYTLEGSTKSGEDVTYDIQFAQPLMEKAVQPTQTLSLLEDALLLSSLSRIVKFVNVDCGNAEEEEIRDALEEIKSSIEQQLSLNTANGDVQSFVNPQSPNNLIYLPKINGNDAISITDLNMADSTESDNKLLEYYQNKKLSVLGIPKEAMNFSGAEGLGNAGSVMSQRSALYANALLRLETAYKEGWRDAFNKYFMSKGLSGYVDKFTLNMNPIVTEMETLRFEKRDSAISQADQVVNMLKSLGVSDKKDYVSVLSEILSESLPKTGASVSGWDIDTSKFAEGEGGLDDAL